jgi:glycosyltransferase involved in cell wall biosynthesis
MVVSDRLLEQFAVAYARVWEVGAISRWARCDVLHLLLHGTGLSLLRRAKAGSTRVIVEAVNQHPEAVEEILVEESDRLGLSHSRRRGGLQRRLLAEAKSSDWLLAPSSIVRDSFVSRGYQKSRTSVIAYGVDLARFYPVEKDQKADQVFRVICVAQITQRKGQVYLLEAWRNAHLLNAELLLIGSLSHEMRSVLRRYEGTFRHIPFVPNNELSKYYGQSCVFVLPSLEDGFGCVVAEAMACGLPVIVTANTGAADIITHGKDGFVVPIRSPESIAEYLELLYRNPALREEMSQAALNKVRSELGWDSYAKRLIHVYQSVFDAKAETTDLADCR